MDFTVEYNNLVTKKYISPTRIDETVESKDDDDDDDDNNVTDAGFIQNRDEDEADKLCLNSFYEKDCCTFKCTDRIPKEVALHQRLNFMELAKEEQDLVICSHLELHRHLNSLSNEYKRTMVTEESTKGQSVENRQRVSYFFADLPVCKKIYLFLHNLSIKRYKNIINHFNENGLCLRKHKLAGKASTRKNAIKAEDLQIIVNFIQTYAEKVAIPLPGRLPQVRNFHKVVKLTSCDTKTSIYRKFLEAADSDKEIRVVSESSFFQIWNGYCPEIMTMKPATDLCDTCRQNHLKLAKISHMTTEEQEKILEDSKNHLETAKLQRDFYNFWREKVQTNETSSFMVISFDYAQNVAYPSSPQQVGSSFFKANRKCSIFGVNNESSHVQTNFLIDEKDNAGKGANAVISMLHSYLSINEIKNLVLFADNCVGQNKNNALLQYLLWRVMTGKNESISLNFLLTGHTKFSPDRNFGILKTKYAKAVVDCLEDLIDVVNTSSPNKFNVALPSVDPTSNVRNVHWSEWEAFLKQQFNKIPGLTKYHHFKFKKDGEIWAQLFTSSPEVLVHGKIDLSTIKISPLKKLNLRDSQHKDLGIYTKKYDLFV